MGVEGDINMEMMSDLIKGKRDREGLSLRDAAAAMGITAPTLQRIEAGQLPTAAVLLKVADWLGVQVDDLRMRRAEKQTGTVEQIEVFLRADPNLDRKAAQAIATIVREVYDGFVRSKKGK